MTAYPGLITDRLELVSVIHPDALQGTYYTPWLSAAQRERWLFVLLVGDIVQGGTIDLEVQQAQDDAGTGAAAILGKEITQLTKAAGDGDDAVCIELGAAEMDAANNFDHVRARLDIGTAANVALLVFAQALRYQPAPAMAWTERVE